MIRRSRATRAELCPQGRHRLPLIWFPSRGCRGCSNEQALADTTTVVLSVLPGVAQQLAHTALVAVTAGGPEEYRAHRHRKIAAYLVENPQSLTSGSSSVPIDVARLITQLREAGCDQVVDPRCADCAKPCFPRQHRPDGLRICVTCDSRRRKAPCRRCGRTNRIFRRDDDGHPLCQGCHQADPASWQTCGLCQQPAPIQVTLGQVRVGRCCYRKRHERCSVCGLGRAISPYASGKATCAQCATAPRSTCARCALDAPYDQTGQPTCLRCADGSNQPCRVCNRPTVSRDRHGTPQCTTCLTRIPRQCGGCGRRRVIARRAHGHQPDLCGSCWRGPTVACQRCGRLRPCFGQRSGRMLCAACRPHPRRQCAYCGHRRTVSAVWAAGPACASCYRQFMRAKATCPGCGQHRRVLPYPTSPQPLCATCAGAPPGPVCGQCGNEDWLYHKDRCARCVLSQRLSTLLGDHHNRDRLGLQQLHDTLLNAQRPEAVISWMSPSAPGTAHQLLTQLGRGHIQLSHDTLDALNTPGNGGTANHLDAILTAIGALPARDLELARLERAVAAELATVNDQDQRKILRSYATWNLLRRARTTSQSTPLTAGARYSALNRLATAAHLLSWLAQQHHNLASCPQHHLDAYLAEHPNRRHDLAGFLTWARDTRRSPRLTIASPPKPLPRTIPAEHEHHWAAARALLHDHGYTPADRVAGLLTLLFAQRPGRISRLRINDITIHDDQVAITLGKTPIHLPEPLARHMKDLIDTRRPKVNKHLPDPGPWLFPGAHPDRPTQPGTITDRLQRLGIQPTAHRATALLHLASHMPPTILQDLLGLGRNAAQQWSTLAGRPWAQYVADRLEDDPPSADDRPHPHREPANN